MAVITIAVCDEIRKDAQKLYRQLSTLLPDAEILIYRSRQSLLDGLTEGHKICNSLRKESKVVQTKKQYGDFSLTALSFASISIFSG